MLTLRQTNRPKIALTSMCMELTYKCHLLGLSLLLARLCSHVVAALAGLLRHFPSSKSLDCPLFSFRTISCQLISRFQPGPMTCVSCLVCPWYVEPFFFFISSFCCFFHAMHIIRPSASRRCPLSGPIEAELPDCWVLLKCGIDPRTSGRMDCDVMDVNSAPVESAKDNPHFHVHGTHLWVSLAWSFPSPCLARLCSHVVVALAWPLQLSLYRDKWITIIRSWWLSQ